MADYIDPRTTRPITHRLVGEGMEAINTDQGGGGVDLPIAISDVEGLQDELNSKGTSDLELGNTEDTAMPGNTPIPSIDGLATSADLAALVARVEALENAAEG